MIHESILAAIGRTPLIALRGPSREAGARILGKAESLNPGGSVKDRIGVAMLDAAEAAGRLRPGDTIVEATAGNTGVALAQAAAARGYRCVFVMPAKMSRDKEDLLRAYGAEVRRTADAPPDDPRNFQALARHLSHTEGWFLPDQFANEANPNIHERTTGAEIWDDLGHDLDAFVAGVGTGGTLSGVGRALKQRNPAVRIVLADPQGSTLSGGPAGSYALEGIGTSRAPANYDPEVVDDAVTVSDRDAFTRCRSLAREEGLLLGGAAGCAVEAAVRYARDHALKTVVAVLPDTGRNYLSKIYDDDWFAELPD